MYINDVLNDVYLWIFGYPLIYLANNWILKEDFRYNLISLTLSSISIDNQQMSIFMKFNKISSNLHFKSQQPYCRTSKYHASWNTSFAFSKSTVLQLQLSAKKIIGRLNIFNCFFLKLKKNNPVITSHFLHFIIILSQNVYKSYQS